MCSPETAAASALTGVITDPRSLSLSYERIPAPSLPIINTSMLLPPLPPAEAKNVRLEKTPNITTLPELGRIADTIKVPILLKVGDDISTDDIMPAGARVMPYWSNIPKTSEFTFELVDDTYAKRARQGGATRPGHAIVAGTNYGQGSSRENAALAPRYLGLEVVLAKSFARIHWQNLINFGVLPLTFSDPAIFDRLEIGDVVEIAGIEAGLSSGQTVTANINGKPLALRHGLSARQIDLVLRGGIINWLRERIGSGTPDSSASKVA